MQLTLNPKMTTPQVVEKSVTANNNSFLQDYYYYYYYSKLFNFLNLICNFFYC